MTYGQWFGYIRDDEEIYNLIDVILLFEPEAIFSIIRYYQRNILWYPYNGSSSIDILVKYIDCCIGNDYWLAKSIVISMITRAA